ncbi:hypothetical protein NDR87_30930 [Nocardia sp. CDC159]|uniref:Uncharacterized protein n=1 Tax=Nocardia pulmonis TaxID=2951408 RepID=A0A9X2EEM1_9NOCA|nr:MULTISPECIES: hypothetical protein [Nocardia]MCM6778035.1 hypothetical protein [Nocardia pulmonis]MCM6790794.1 hypothetical protein [Nocardia sp. CDC159]
MTALFDLTDVQEIAGETYEEPELTQVNRFIAIAEAKIRSKVSRIDDRIASGDLDPVLVKGVGAEVVMRAVATLRRGLGVRRTEYPEISTEYEPATAQNLVYVTDEDVADLIDTAEDADAFTIRTAL